MIKTSGGPDYRLHKYGRLGVFYHRLFHDHSHRRMALCSPETWSNVVEWDTANDPPKDKICPACSDMEAKE